MNRFSISDLEQFSGIKAHTIRIWEKRYNALKPERSEGNTRSYNNSQLKRLLNIVSLMKSNYKISELGKMSDSKMNELIGNQISAKQKTKDPYEHFITRLILAGIEYDEVSFKKLFSNCTSKYGLKTTYTHVIYPLLIRLGLMWSNESIVPSSEHFIVSILKQKLFTAIDSLPLAESPDTVWVLFLPENEFHLIGLLFANYLIRFSGQKVIYLGANIPFESLIDTVDKTKPANLLFFLVHNNTHEESQKYIDKLRRHFKRVNIYLSGNISLIDKLKIAYM